MLALYTQVPVFGSHEEPVAVSQKPGVLHEIPSHLSAASRAGAMKCGILGRDRRQALRPGTLGRSLANRSTQHA